MKFLVDEIAKPISRRIGSFVAGMVGTFGLLAPDQLADLEMAITVVCALALDLFLSHLNRMKVR